MPTDHPLMPADEVIAFVQLLHQHNIDVILDGGWGVDALLNEQTRPHNDLDIALLHKDVPQARALLEARGYKEVPRDDSWECNFVLGDDLGHEIDFHSCTFDEAGNNVFGVKYPLDSWSGSGTINGFPVKCIEPHWMVKFHTGYKLDENDYRDVKALCRRFGLEIPAEYDAFRKRDGDN